MGRAVKLKQQRKIEKIEQQIKRKAMIRKYILGFFGFILFIALALGIFSLTNFIKEKYFTKKGNLTQEANKIGDHKYDKAPSMIIDKNKKYIAKFETSQGNFEVELNAKEAPKTVNNFVFLARDGFYNGLTFHRIINNFMIQGGDPEGTGSGGPGYTIPEEIKLKHEEGSIAMARLGDEANPKKDSSGSQFFIDLSPQPSLDTGGYTVFGKVVKGMDVVKKLGSVAVKDSGSGETSTPIEKQMINKITVEEN